MEQIDRDLYGGLSDSVSALNISVVKLNSSFNASVGASKYIMGTFMACMLVSVGFSYKTSLDSLATLRNQLLANTEASEQRLTEYTKDAEDRVLGITEDLKEMLSKHDDLLYELRVQNGIQNGVQKEQDKHSKEPKEQGF